MFIIVPLQEGYKQLQKGYKLMQGFLHSAFPKAPLKHPVSLPESYTAPLKSTISLKSIFLLKCSSLQHTASLHPTNCSTVL